MELALAVTEAVAVADKLGIDLPFVDPIAHVKKTCEATHENRASMFQDILRGAGTEVSVINRAVAKKGREVGVETPCNVFLAQVIEALEATAAFRC